MKVYKAVNKIDYRFEEVTFLRFRLLTFLFTLVSAVSKQTSL